MEYYGTSYKKMKKKKNRINHGNLGELSSQYKDKLIDYVFVNMGLPGAAVIDMLISRKGDLYPLPDDMMADFKKKYGYNSGTIPAGLYKNQNNDVKTGNMATIILVSQDVSEDVVYRVTKAICEKEDKLVEIHGSMDAYKCATATENATIPVHPGALKYYKEMGYVK